jgi:hypothetical protein
MLTHTINVHTLTHPSVFSELGHQTLTIGIFGFDKLFTLLIRCQTFSFFAFGIRKKFACSACSVGSNCALTILCSLCQTLLRFIFLCFPSLLFKIFFLSLAIARSLSLSLSQPRSRSLSLLMLIQYIFLYFPISLIPNRWGPTSLNRKLRKKS